MSPPCTCSSIVCLGERIEVWSLYAGEGGGGGLRVHTLDSELLAMELKTCFSFYPRA